MKIIPNIIYQIAIYNKSTTQNSNDYSFSKKKALSMGLEFNFNTQNHYILSFSMHPHAQLEEWEAKRTQIDLNYYKICAPCIIYT